MKKIAIYYDSLVSKGGAERLVIQLANMLDADIITSGYDTKINEWISIKNNVFDIGNISIKFIKPMGTLFESPIRYYFAKNKFRHSINIFLGSASIFASNKNNINIWYCLSPNRILYDLRNIRVNDASFIKRILFRLHIKLFNNSDQKIIKSNFKSIISQSINVQKRVKKYYGINSPVIYPPIETNTIKFQSFGNYYLTVARLYEDKRVSLIAKSFIKMPTKKLIIVGNGPERNKIINLIKGHTNITLLNNISDGELFNLYANCLATVFMPRDEDYGLVPVEEMAAGKSCIATNNGGCKETVIDRKTGYLIEATEESIINAVEKLNIKKAKAMKNNCLNWVKRFDAENYLKQWNKELKKFKVI